MTVLTNLSPAASYGDLLTCNNSGQGLINSLQQIQDGFGNPSALQLATNIVNVAGTLQINGTALTAFNSSVTTTLNSGAITTLYNTPVQVLPAPGAGLTYVVFGFSVNYLYNAAVYANGGNIVLTYGSVPHGTSAVITNGIPATALASAVNSFSYAVGTGSTVALAPPTYVNTAVFVTNQTQLFTTAGGTGQANVTVYYQVLNTIV